MQFVYPGEREYARRANVWELNSLGANHAFESDLHAPSFSVYKWKCEITRSHYKTVDGRKTYLYTNWPQVDAFFH